MQDAVFNSEACTSSSGIWEKTFSSSGCFGMLQFTKAVQ